MRQDLDGASNDGISGRSMASCNNPVGAAAAAAAPSARLPTQSSNKPTGIATSVSGCSLAQTSCMAQMGAFGFVVCAVCAIDAASSNNSAHNKRIHMMTY